MFRCLAAAHSSFAGSSTPEELDSQIRADYALWGGVVKRAGVKAD